MTSESSSDEISGLVGPSIRFWTEGRVWTVSLGLDEGLVLDVDPEPGNRPRDPTEVCRVLADSHDVQIPSTGHQFTDVDHTGNGTDLLGQRLPLVDRNGTDVEIGESTVRALEIDSCRVFTDDSVVLELADSVSDRPGRDVDGFSDRWRGKLPRVTHQLVDDAPIYLVESIVHTPTTQDRNFILPITCWHMLPQSYMVLIARSTIYPLKIPLSTI